MKKSQPWCRDNLAFKCSSKEYSFWDAPTNYQSLLNEIAFKTKFVNIVNNDDDNDKLPSSFIILSKILLASL